MARGQEPLRPSVPGQHILDAVPGGRGNDEQAAAGQALAGRPPTSVDWDGGIVYSRTKSGTKYPDFLISSYYGLKEPGGQELEREVPRLVVEVRSLRPDEVIPTIDDRIAILKQLQSYMARVVAHVDLTKHELPWGLAIIGTYTAWLRPSRRNAQCAWEYIGGFHSGRGYWTSIYGLEFRKYINERADKCRLNSIAYARAYREKLDNLQNAPPENRFSSCTTASECNRCQVMRVCRKSTKISICPASGVRQRASGGGCPVAVVRWRVSVEFEAVFHDNAVAAAQAAAQSTGAHGSTAAEDRVLLKSMCMAAMITGFQRLSNEDTLMVLGITDAMARFWEVLDAPEQSGAAALERLKDVVVLKDVSMEPEGSQGTRGVPPMTRKHGLDDEGNVLIPPDNVSLSAFRMEMRDTFDTEATRVEAVEALLDAEITREDERRMSLERRHIREQQDGIAHYINKLNLRLLPPMVMPIPASPPGQYRQLANGELTKVLDPAEKVQYLDNIIDALMTQYGIMEDYISAEIGFWESVLEGSEREQSDWYARVAPHPVMEDSDYFARGFTEFRGLEDMQEE
ncbi:uncharacterized protein B0H18DRAFT_958922 [Fomitopsis serialis]|uniref:uncharacterized protein n=1 Tax=Fomitopsis serialis TaxID=139415 RepID=UPI00200834BB|nr:uncharacterized protein B0H18DRAFT_958922 [Neoantrodia serialis]KAH9916222.1 hypothetical protein B0H18DRAFT_958922 [Neoantrodia serialis]